jgi:voltage-dependent anion channel protein 2
MTNDAQAKINNSGILGLAYTQALRPGVKATFGGQFDTARFNENAHKLGLSLTLEA